MGPKSNDCHPCKKRKNGDTERRPSKDRGTDWNDVSASQVTPKAFYECGTTSPLEPSKESTLPTS